MTTAATWALVIVLTILVGAWASVWAGKRLRDDDLTALADSLRDDSAMWESE